MSRRSHRHGDRGHGRPPRLELTHPSSPAPAPGPVETSGAPERPVAFEAPERSARRCRPHPTRGTGSRRGRRPSCGRVRRPPPAPRPMPPVERPSAGRGHGWQSAAMRTADGPDPWTARWPATRYRSAGCTSPQLRRFIKSRAYIPMHELRRRFAINGPEDDVAAIDIDGTRLYVGLPEREGRLLGELLRGGDVGAELSHDPVTPIIVGVYPMRPVPRS